MVNNAGIFCGLNKIENESIDAFDKTMVRSEIRPKLSVLAETYRQTKAAETIDVACEYARSFPRDEIRRYSNDEAKAIAKRRAWLDRQCCLDWRLGGTCPRT